MCFIDIIRINHTRIYDIQSVSHPVLSCGISVCEETIASGFDCDIPRVDRQTGM